MTGQQYTLIFNGSIKLSGAIGLALSGGSRPVAETAFPGLRVITASLEIISSEDNLVNKSDNACTTELLASAFAWDDDI